MLDKWQRFIDLISQVLMLALMIYSIGRTIEAAFSERYPEAIFYLLVVQVANYFGRQFRRRAK
jgi:hypothetical protein